MAKRKQLNKCIICEDPIVDNLNICGLTSCEIRYEEYNVDNTDVKEVCTFIKSKSFGLIFIWNISFRAIKNKPVRFRPFPNYFISNKNLKSYHRGDINDIMNIVITKDEYEMVKSIFESVNINDVCAQISDTDTKLIEKFKTITKQPIKVYYLLRFLILSNRTTIETNLLEFSYKINNYQIAIHKVKYDHTTEEKFGYSEDINYLYHGSPDYNWHSILRAGLKNCSNTKLMANAAACGKGIYLSDRLNVSASYIKGGTMLAIVELLESPNKWLKRSGYFVVEDESKILVRYLMTIPKPLRYNGEAILSLGKYIKIFLNSEIETKHQHETISQNKRNLRLKSEIASLILIHETLGTIRQNISIKYNDYLIIKYPHKFKHEKSQIRLQSNQSTTLIKIIIDFPRQYPFKSPIFRIIYPQVKHPQITNTGLFYDTNLFGNSWKPATKLIELIKQFHETIKSSEIISLYDYSINDDDYDKLSCSTKY